MSNPYSKSFAASAASSSSVAVLRLRQINQLLGWIDVHPAKRRKVGFQEAGLDRAGCKHPLNG